MQSPPSRQRGQAAVELLAVVPFLVLLAALIAAAAASSYSWVRAESAARVGARAGIVGASIEEPARRVAPPGSRVEAVGPGERHRGEPGVRVVVPRGTGGARALRLPELVGWSPG